jgi:hypothetical protein
LAVGNPNTPFPLKEIGFWGKKEKKKKAVGRWVGQVVMFFPYHGNWKACLPRIPGPY